MKVSSLGESRLLGGILGGHPAMETPGELPWLCASPGQLYFPLATSSSSLFPLSLLCQVLDVHLPTAKKGETHLSPVSYCCTNIMYNNSGCNVNATLIINLGHTMSQFHSTEAKTANVCIVEQETVQIKFPCVKVPS